MIYVNDGSTDGTQAVLDRLKGEFPMLRAIRHQRACGQSQAVTTGVRAARYEWIATLDGDGQNDPADIPALLAALAEPQQPANLELLAGWRTKAAMTPSCAGCRRKSPMVSVPACSGQHPGYRLRPEGLRPRNLPAPANFDPSIASRRHSSFEAVARRSPFP